MEFKFDTNKITQSKPLILILWIIGALIVLLFVFKAGESVGFRRASFSYRWGENYYRGIAGPPRGGMMRMMGDRGFMMSHGVAGMILQASTSTLIIRGMDGLEKTILINDKTVVARSRETLTPSDLKVDDWVLIVGAPTENGEIEAKLIRIVPAPAPASSSAEFFEKSVERLDDLL
jgi:hypothetical protein